LLNRNVIENQQIISKIDSQDSHP